MIAVGRVRQMMSSVIIWPSVSVRRSSTFGYLMEVGGFIGRGALMAVGDVTGRGALMDCGTPIGRGALMGRGPLKGARGDTNLGDLKKGT